MNRCIIDIHLARRLVGARSGAPASTYPHLSNELQGCKFVPAEVRWWAKQQRQARDQQTLKRKQSASENQYALSSPFSSYAPPSSDFPTTPPSTPTPSSTSHGRSIPDSLFSDISNTPHRPKAKRTRTEPIRSIQEVQRAFETDLLRLFITCNIPWHAADNAQLIAFFKTWIPQVTVPGRRVLSGRVLDAEAARVEDETRKAVGGKLVTGQCDG